MAKVLLRSKGLRVVVALGFFGLASVATVANPTRIFSLEQNLERAKKAFENNNKALLSRCVDALWKTLLSQASELEQSLAYEPLSVALPMVAQVVFSCVLYKGAIQAESWTTLLSFPEYKRAEKQHPMLGDILKLLCQLADAATQVSTKEKFSRRRWAKFAATQPDVQSSGLDEQHILSVIREGKLKEIWMQVQAKTPTLTMREVPKVTESPSVSTREPIQAGLGAEDRVQISVSPTEGQPPREPTTRGQIPQTATSTEQVAPQPSPTQVSSIKTDEANELISQTVPTAQATSFVIGAREHRAELSKVGVTEEQSTPCVAEPTGAQGASSSTTSEEPAVLASVDFEDPRLILLAGTALICLQEEKETKKNMVRQLSRFVRTQWKKQS